MEIPVPSEIHETVEISLAWIPRRAAVLRPFATVMKLEIVIFYDLVGYRRNGVGEDFYRSFRPDDVTCLQHRVEAIYQATEPELRENFKRTFLDNWVDRRSFVLISY